MVQSHRRGAGVNDSGAKSVGTAKAVPFFTVWKWAPLPLLSSARAVSDGLLFPAAGKAAKRAGRNRWFLHFLARYALCKFVTLFHAFTETFPFRITIERFPQQRRCR